MPQVSCPTIKISIAGIVNAARLDLERGVILDTHTLRIYHRKQQAPQWDTHNVFILNFLRQPKIQQFP